MYARRCRGPAEALLRGGGPFATGLFAVGGARGWVPGGGVGWGHGRLGGRSGEFFLRLLMWTRLLVR